MVVVVGVQVQTVPDLLHADDVGLTSSALPSGFAVAIGLRDGAGTMTMVGCTKADLEEVLGRGAASAFEVGVSTLVEVGALLGAGVELGFGATVVVGFA